jgi:hypothetical protein
VLFSGIYFKLTERNIVGVNTYLPISKMEIFKQLLYSYKTIDKQSIVRKQDNKTIFIGFSSRALFHVTLMTLSEKHKDLKILTTPIHHTSFVKIMKDTSNKFIDIDNYNNLNIVEDDIKWCDIIVITHLFGRSFNLDTLIALKNKYNKLLLVDVIIGNKFDNNSEHVDILYMSTGMDKRPVCYGGGLIYINSKHEELIDNIEHNLNMLPHETLNDRRKSLVNYILLHILYMNTFVHNVVFTIFRLLNISLSESALKYRKVNPGFEHNAYLKKPVDGLIDRIYGNINNYHEIEKKYEDNWYSYLNQFSKEEIEYFYPWYINTRDVIMPYNQICIKPELQSLFIDYCDKNNCCVVPNANYALLSTDEKYKLILASIINLPTIHIQTPLGILTLVNILKNFYKKHN